MSGTTIVARRRKSDGKLVRVFPDGCEEPFPDPGPLPHLTEDEINAAALSDPDNPPSTPERAKLRRRLPQVRQMRRALRLTQEEFSERFRIPLGTLRDWEQGKSEPDQAAKAYLRVIARIPDAVQAALAERP
jgi:putative transcriptional regulator